MNARASIPQRNHYALMPVTTDSDLTGFYSVALIDVYMYLASYMLICQNDTGWHQKALPVQPGCFLQHILQKHNARTNYN